MAQPHEASRRAGPYGVVIGADGNVDQGFGKRGHPTGITMENGERRSPSPGLLNRMLQCDCEIVLSISYRKQAGAFYLLRGRVVIDFVGFALVDVVTPAF